MNVVSLWLFVFLITFKLNQKSLLSIRVCHSQLRDYSLSFLLLFSKVNSSVCIRIMALFARISKTHVRVLGCLPCGLQLRI